MKNTIHLIDGSTVEIPEARFMKFIQMLTNRGIKSVRFDDTIIMVSQSNIISIEIGEETFTGLPTSDEIVSHMQSPTPA